MIYKIYYIIYSKRQCIKKLSFGVIAIFLVFSFLMVNFVDNQTDHHGENKKIYNTIRKTFSPTYSSYLNVTYSKTIQRGKRNIDNNVMRETHIQSLKVSVLMDPTKDPCTNFFEFACGGPRIAQTDRSHNNVLLNFIRSDIDLKFNKTMPFLKVYKQFFMTCLQGGYNYDYKTRLKFILEDINKSISKNITFLFSELILSQSLPLFDVSVNFLENTDSFTLRFANGESELKSKLKNWDYQERCNTSCLNKERRNIYTEDTIPLDDMYERYIQCSETCYLDGFSMFLKQVENELNFYQEFLKEKSKIVTFLNNLVDYPKSTGNIVTISVDDLKKQFQIVGLDWLELLQLITGKQNVNGKIQIDLDYFTILIDEMSRLKFNTETLKYFLLISQGLTWYENTVVRKSVERSEFFCIGLTRQLMPDVTNYIFQKITPKEKFKNDRQLKYVADIQNKIEKAFNNSVVSDVQWTKMIRNIRFVTETPHDTKFEVALQKVYGPVALAGDFQVDLHKLIKIYRKQIFNLTFSRDSKEKNKLFTYFINSYDENPHLFNSINTIAIPFGMFYSVSENLPEVIRYSKLTFRLARAIMKKFNLNTIRTMGKYIETIYENVLYNSLYDTISDYAGKSISLDFESDLSAENRLLENSAFSIVDLYKPNVSQKLPWFSNYTSSQMFYLTAAQEYCLDKEDLIDFMYKSKTNNPLSAAYQIENIVYNTPNFFNCVNDDAVSFPLHTLKENNS